MIKSVPLKAGARGLNSRKLSENGLVKAAGIGQLKKGKFQGWRRGKMESNRVWNIKFSFHKLESIRVERRIKGGADSLEIYLNSFGGIIESF